MRTVEEALRMKMAKVGEGYSDLILNTLTFEEMCWPEEFWYDLPEFIFETSTRYYRFEKGDVIALDK